MKYISVDLETTGLSPRTDQVLQIAMVLEDTEENAPVEELPYINLYVTHERLEGHPTALLMNAGLLARIYDTDLDDDIWRGPEDQAWGWVAEWVRMRQFYTDGKKAKMVLAGKNVAGFDRHFFPAHVDNLFHHRVIDAGSVCVDWEQVYVPSLESLLRKMEGPRSVTHDALEDARDVVRVLRWHRQNT